MTMYEQDPLAALEAAGFPIDRITEDQRAVFGTLSDDEVALLIGIRSRLDAVEPEVLAHTDVAGGGLF